MWKKRIGDRQISWKMNMKIPFLPVATEVYSCHSSFGLKGAPSESLIQMTMNLTMAHSPKNSTHQNSTSI